MITARHLQISVLGACILAWVGLTAATGAAAFVGAVDRLPLHWLILSVGALAALTVGTWVSYALSQHRAELDRSRKAAIRGVLEQVEEKDGLAYADGYVDGLARVPVPPQRVTRIDDRRRDKRSSPLPGP